MSQLTRITLPNGAIVNDGQNFIGAGSLFTTGSVLYVCSVNGSDGNSGLDPAAPLATIQQANTNAVANKGWKVIVMPGHAETVTATSHTLSKAGVSYICLGSGLDRPTFTYGAAAATITVSGANVAFIGGHFIANFLNVAAAFTVGAAKDFQVLNNTFVDTSSILNFLSIVVTGATNNAADGLTFSQNYVYGLAATDGAVVSVLGNLLRLQITENIVDKAATNDAGHMLTMSSKVCGGVRILRNNLTVVGSAGASVGIFMTGSSTTSSGICAYNTCNSLDTTAALFSTTGTKISFQENYTSGAVDASGTLFPAADNPA